MSDVTRILSKIESGDQKASEELLPLVYDELRQLATARMANERADHTLQATALVLGLDLAGKPAAGQVAYVGFYVSILGAVNGDNLVDVKDIDDLSIAIQSGSADLRFDLNDGHRRCPGTIQLGAANSCIRWTRLHSSNDLD